MGSKARRRWSQKFAISAILSPPRPRISTFSSIATGSSQKRRVRRVYHEVKNSEWVDVEDDTEGVVGGPPDFQDNNGSPNDLGNEAELNDIPMEVDEDDSGPVRTASQVRGTDIIISLC